MAEKIVFTMHKNHLPVKRVAFTFSNLHQFPL